MVNKINKDIILNTLRIMALLFTIILVLHLGSALLFFDKYVTIFEIYISPDGHLEDAFRVFSVISYGLIWLIVFIISHYILYSREDFYYTWNISAIFIFSGSVFIIISWYLFHRTIVYREDNLIETASALVAIAAGCLFLFSAWLNRDELKLFYLLWGAVFLFIGFEEISWGQRIFGWKTPDMWKDINEQNETNLHNLLNFLFLPIYFFVAIFLALIFLLSDLIRRIFIQNDFVKLFIPDKNYIILSYIFFFLSITSLIIGTEMSEEVYYFMAISFSWLHLRDTIRVKSLPPN